MPVFRAGSACGRAGACMRGRRYNRCSMVRTGWLLAFAISVPAFAAPTYRVIDRYPGRSIASSEPRFVATSSGLLIGSAWDSANGRELWVSDGTAEGTTIVRDILPGPSSSNPQSFVELGGVTYFLASGTGTPFGVTSATQLWRTDGTPGGTWRIETLADPMLWPGGVEGPVVVDGRLLLLAADSDGWTLWRSDGTTKGTTRLLEYFTAWSPNLEGLTVFDDRAYFTVNGSELWASDGTTAGTVLIFTWFAGLDGALMTVSGGWLYFIAEDWTSGQELWRTDGTPSGTRLVKDLVPGQAGSRPSHLTDVGGTLYFASSEPVGLWRTDGTAEGTVAVHVDSPVPLSDFGWLTALGAELLFVAGDEVHGEELWAVDQVSSSARLVRDIAAGPYWSSPSDLFTHQGRLFFSASDGAMRGLWSSDGTEAGTQLVTQDAWEPRPSSPPGFASAGSLLYFAASETEHGAELWVTDGASPGTRMVANLAADAGGAALGRVAALPRLLMFGDFGPPWRSDGSAAGTFTLPVVDAEEIVAVGNVAFLRALDAQHGWGLHISDGTAAGTRRVESVEALGWSDPSTITAAGGGAYFLANDTLSSRGTGLLRTDGSEAGTELVAAPVHPRNRAAVGDRLFFADYETGELWRSESSGPGIVRIAQFLTSPNQPGNFHALGEALLFTADDAISGVELWHSDGSVAGTTLVADICPGYCAAFEGDAYGNAPTGHFASGGGVLYFLADDRVHGREVWRSDGTAAGTWLVADLAPGPDSATVRLLGVLGGVALFSLDEGDGPRLWASDGTADGTHRVAGAEEALVPADGWLVTSGGLAYLGAADPLHGLEPWVSDGTTASLLADIAPGPSSSSPAEAALVGPRLFFSADDGVSGRELWAAVLRPPRPARRVFESP